jgi:hypothetical protein
MKTKTNKKMKLNALTFAMTTVLMLSSACLSAQEEAPKTLLKSEISITDLFVPEFKMNSIQGDMGSLIGFYGGPLINRSFLVGACGGVNLGHPRVNYGYFGGIGQYILRPDDMVHLSGQLVIAWGTTKDYENPKSGPLDNFWNISGASFFMMEPGVNLEVNITNRMMVAIGVSYRYVTGLNENSEDISRTHVTNQDMSGVNFNIGLKFNREKNVRDK